MHHDNAAVVNILLHARLGHFDCADRHDNGHGNSGGRERIMCTDKYSRLDRKPGRNGKLECADGNNHDGGKPNGLG